MENNAAPTQKKNFGSQLKALIKSFTPYQIGYLVTVLLITALFIIFMILIHLLGKLLDLVNRIPGFKQVNGFLGMVLALAEAVLVIDLFLLILVPLSGTSVGQYLVDEIHKSKILTWLYENNFLVYLFNLAKQKIFG